MTNQTRAVTITQRLKRRLDFEIQHTYQCHQPVPHYGGGGGSRYYGPSYFQCARRGVWEVVDESGGVTARYCAAHARKHGLLTADGPLEGVRRDRY